MRTITTKKGTFEVDFAWVNFEGKCIIHLADNRRIPAIAEDFDRLESIRFEDDETNTTHEWTDFTRLESIIPFAPGVVQITLVREV